MKTMKEYRDLHLKCNVLFLADAMLNMTTVEFELISDADMYIFLKEGTKGGVSDIYKRYSKANTNI